MIGWHFIREDRRLGYGDGRAVEVGKTYKVYCKPVLCDIGLHASKRAQDALTYAHGPVACRVRLGGTIVHGYDKSVATERAVLAMTDATDVLYKFARLCALDVIHLWDAPDVMMKFLKTGDESLMSTAGAAARAAAGAAAWAAAWAVARDAACVAARAAARAATRAVAWDVARDAARDAAGAATRAVARDVERDAARAAARAKQNKRLARMLNRAMK